jgi:hypothetical protein
MRKVLTLILFFSLATGFGFAQTNLLPNGDLETIAPNFWHAVGDDQDGVTCSWAWVGYDGSEHSFQIEKTGSTASMAGWMSVNNADLYWNNAAADALYNLSFWVKTEGVNTAPASDDAKIGVIYTFFNDGTSIGEKIIYIDQSAADADWTEYTDGLLITPGLEPDEVYVGLVMGKDATGTVWFDNIGCGTDPWSMGIFNSNAETPVGWLNWTSGSDIGYANLDDSNVYEGTWAVRLEEDDDLGDEMVFYSEPIAADPDSWYKIGVWVHTFSDSVNAEWIPTGETDYKHDHRMNLCFFSHAGDIMTSWSPTGGDRFVYFDERELEIGWTHVTFLYKTEEDATGLSVRARFNNFTEGICFYDDFTVEKVELGENLLPNGDLETLEPNFWNPFGDDQNGVTCGWAWVGYDGSEHSFMIEKTGQTDDAAGWESVNNADLYWNNAAADALYNLSFWVKTEGVNTAPANDDEKIGVTFEFYHDGTSIGEKTIWVDQSVADADWTEYTDGLLITPGFEPDEVYVSLYMGLGATGTVWFDNIGCGTDPWSMGIFNSNAETPVGWLNWTSGSEIGYANLDDTEFHSGMYSAKLEELDENADEMVFYSEPIAADPSSWYQISVWAKTESDSVNAEWLTSAEVDFKNDYRMNLCFFSHAGDIMTSWSPTGGDRFFYFDEREVSRDWTFYQILYMTEEDATGISVRARFNNFTMGTCWYDDFEVREVTILETAVEDWDPADPQIPVEFGLEQNFPNPFNPTTQIGYMLEKDGLVELSVYNVMGQKIRTLVSGHRQAGMYKIMWDGRDEQGNPVDSGVYLYQLRTKDNVVTKRMVLVK